MFLNFVASVMAFLFLALTIVAKTIAMILTVTCSTKIKRVAESFIAAPKSAKAAVVTGLRPR